MRQWLDPIVALTGGEMLSCASGGKDGKDGQNDDLDTSDSDSSDSDDRNNSICSVCRVRGTPRRRLPVLVSTPVICDCEAVWLVRWLCVRPCPESGSAAVL